MRSVLKLAAFLCLVAGGSAYAQCPSADALLGPTKDYKKLRMKYDDFTDSTTVMSGAFSTAPMNGNPAHAFMWTYFAGKAPSDSATTTLTVTVEKMGEGGAIMGGRGNTLTPANAHFADVKEGLFKFSDGSRMRIPVVSNKATIEAAGALMPQRLRETLVFQFSPETRLQFARAEGGEFRFGDYTMHFDSEQTQRDMGNTIRYLTCKQ